MFKISLKRSEKYFRDAEGPGVRGPGNEVPYFKLLEKCQSDPPFHINFKIIKYPKITLKINVSHFTLKIFLNNRKNTSPDTSIVSSLISNNFVFIFIIKIERILINLIKMMDIE